MAPHRDYPITVLSTVVALIGLGLAGVYLIPQGNLGLGALLGLIAVVVNTLIGTAQAEGNGHRLTAVETSTKDVTNRIDAASVPQSDNGTGAPPNG